MAKVKSHYVCGSCGYESPRWVGRCPGCGAWNTLEETGAVAQVKASAAPRTAKQRLGTGSEALLLRDIPEDVVTRLSTGISELDRVLGGGVVEGGLMLIGGDPGIGKSTLLLQVCDHLSQAGRRVLYVTGEESARQVKLRANRLGINAPNLYILAENALDGVPENLQESDRYYGMEEAVEFLEAAGEALEEAVDNMENAVAR